MLALRVRVWHHENLGRIRPIVRLLPSIPGGYRFLPSRFVEDVTCLPARQPQEIAGRMGKRSLAKVCDCRPRNPGHRLPRTPPRRRCPPGSWSKAPALGDMSISTALSIGGKVLANSVQSVSRARRPTGRNPYGGGAAFLDTSLGRRRSAPAPPRDESVSISPVKTIKLTKLPV